MKLAEELRQVSVSSTSAEITVRSPAQSKVALISDKTSVIVGDTVTFSVIVNPPMPGAQFQFDFGDGPEQTTSSSQIAHIYTVASTYNPMVMVLTKGARESATGTPITVSAQPVAQPGVPNQFPQTFGLANYFVRQGRRIRQSCRLQHRRQQHSHRIHQWQHSDCHVSGHSGH
jgi:hypothetical protein